MAPRPRPRLRVLAAAILLTASTLASAGCVTKVRYDQLVADTTAAKLDADAKQKDADGRIQALQDQLTAAASAMQDRDARLSDLSTQHHNLQAELDEQTAMNEQLRGELGRLGKDVDKILVDKGTLAKALDDAKARLDELRKAQAASEARVELFRDFGRRFKPLVDAGQLQVGTRRGQLVMAVPGDVLFDPGHTEVRTAGKGLLMEMARALQLASSPTTGRRYVVTGHVDPMEEPTPPTEPKAHAKPLGGRADARKLPKPKSAWELSSDQAVAVVEYLVLLGVPADSLTAAGAGSFDPLVPNDNAESRAKNRRIEIALMPDGEGP